MDRGSVIATGSLDC